MQTHQETGPRPCIALPDLQADKGNEPRIYDLRLAAALRFDQPRSIRKLIRRHRDELESFGALLEIKDRTGGAGNLFHGGSNTPKAGRPGMAFYLSEGQCLAVCAVSHTKVAAQVRSELIKVFLLHRRRQFGYPVPREFGPLLDTESSALYAIIANADVVMAPPCNTGEYEYQYGIGREADPRPNSDGLIPYLLAPITEGILDALAALGSQDDGLEPDEDLEPSFGGSDDKDREHDPADDEFTLGSLEKTNQADWAGGTNSDAEAQCEDEGADIDNSDPASGDGEDDRADWEPSLGFLETVDQRSANRGDGDDKEQDDSDREPSLGSPISAIHDQRAWSHGDTEDREFNGDELDDSFDEDTPIFGYGRGFEPAPRRLKRTVYNPAALRRLIGTMEGLRP